jgi:hypothetical protein
LRIYDALIKAMEALGWAVTVGGRDNDETYVIIHGAKIRIGIEEHVKQAEHVLTPEEERDKARYSYSFAPKWDYHPTGELTLRIKNWGGNGLRKSCCDSKREILVDRIAEFLEIVRKFAAHELAEGREREREARKRAAEQARLAELRAQQEAENKRIQQLELEAGAWHNAERIRSFIQAALQAGMRDETWGKWAMDYADRLDPLSPS